MSQVEYNFCFGDFAFLVKRHRCPKCSFKRLKLRYETVEIADFNKTNINELNIGKYHFVGNKTVKEPHMYCENCNSTFTFNEIKSFEKHK